LGTKHASIWEEEMYQIRKKRKKYIRMVIKNASDWERGIASVGEEK
jgi:hypothetical protein